MSQRMLGIGCVKYLNARPLIRGWPGDVDFDHPSILCQRLARGEVDVALVSSFEFLRNPIYRIVDDVSISSDGPVYSVVVAHRGDISEVGEIELDPASQTAVNLLRCLLAQRGLSPRLVERSTEPSPGAVQLDSASRGLLLIGDQAIRFRREDSGDLRFWDLGEQWKKVIDRPFVYALWLIRPEVADADNVAQRLRTVRDENLAALNELITETVADNAASGESKQINHEFLSRYYRKHLRFSFGEAEKEGLRRFANLCREHALLEKRDLVLNVV